MAQLSVPLRTAMFDEQGNLTRTWILYFNSLGTAASAGSSGAGVVTVPNVAGTFTPDLSQGTIQYVLLTADAKLAGALNETAGLPWILIVDQDATGGHNLIFDPTYFYAANLLGTAAAATRAQSQWVCDANGNNSLSGVPSTDQPIPA
jgi:hypothetical protein